MKLRLKPVVLLLCCTALLLSGCKDKKKQPTVPAQAQAPDVTPPTATDKDQPKPPTTPPKRPKPRPAKPAPKPATDTKQASDKDKDKPVEVAANTPPPKIIIQEGGTGATASAPAATAPLNEHTEAAHNRATTDQLLDSTETNLRTIKRQLSSDEQATVAQVRDFMTQSRQALKDNDQVRARNLAMKAHLLSDELVKQR
jgi:hypothetical protein